MPVIVTQEPPAVDPEEGETDETTGVPIYVNWSAALVVDVPPVLVTVTWTVPMPAGERAVIWVELLTVTFSAEVLPNFTAVAPEKLVPVKITLVPPVVGPAMGEINATVGGDGKLVMSEALTGAGITTNAPRTSSRRRIVFITGRLSIGRTHKIGVRMESIRFSEI